MIVHHERWPLVVQVVATAPTDADLDRQFEAWERWFDRRQTFAVLTCFETTESMRPMPGGIERAAHWLAVHRPRIVTWVAAMASVRPANGLVMPPPGDGTAAFGVPFAWFPDTSRAIPWLLAAVEAHGPPSADRSPTSPAAPR